MNDFELLRALRPSYGFFLSENFVETGLAEFQFGPNSRPLIKKAREKESCSWTDDVNQALSA